MQARCGQNGTSGPVYADDLVAVPKAHVEEEHFIISQTGVTHVAPDGNTVTSLHEWFKESTHFAALKQMTHFRLFPLVRTLAMSSCTRLSSGFSVCCMHCVHHLTFLPIVVCALTCKQTRTKTHTS
jgi:hypothetical protein